jgi:hypothetical protein
MASQLAVSAAVWVLKKEKRSRGRESERSKLKTKTKETTNHKHKPATTSLYQQLTSWAIIKAKSGDILARF